MIQYFKAIIPEPAPSAVEEYQFRWEIYYTEVFWENIAESKVVKFYVMDVGRRMVMAVMRMHAIWTIEDW